MNRRDATARLVRRAVPAVLGLMILIFGACEEPFALEGLIDGPDGKPLTVSPTSAVLIANNSLTIETSGGIPPYNYTLVSGTGTLSGNYYTAPPTSGTERIRISDSAGARVEAVYTISAGAVTLAISPSSQTVYTGGSVSFSTVGGTGPYSYSLTTNSSGGSVGAGTGVYVAGPSAGNDVITLEDTFDASTDTATVTVIAKPLSLSPATISVYTNQTVDFAAVGGDGPFGYEVTTNASGSPTGIGGGASYTYTSGPNPGTDTVTLTDGYDGRTRTAAVTVVSAPVVTNVDYAAGVVTIDPPVTTQTGSAATGSFDIVNNGSANGGEDVHWTIYASADTSIGGSDFVVDFGTIAGGTTAGSTTPVTVNGNWPIVPGIYYLLADVAAADDLSTGDNRNASGSQVDVYAPLTIAPTLIDVYAGQDVTFTAAGGSGSFSYGVSTVGSSNPSFTGNVYTAGDNAGTDIVTVTDTTYSLTANATVNVSATPLSTSVDYLVGVPMNLASTNLAGSTVTGDFSLDNIGTADGGYPVTWTVYASINTVLGPQDFVIDSSTTGQLAASGGTTVGFSGVWPSSAGSYYLIVQTEATDDLSTGNNRGITATQTAVTGTGPLDIEYIVPTVTDPGAAVLTGSVLNETFTLQNSGTDAGSADVYWTAYLSTNTTLEIGTDIPIDSGTASALGAGATSGAISIDGYWPQTAGNWYLIVSESASDEQTAGDIGVSAAVIVNDPAVDYRIPAVNVTGTPALVGSPASATFQIENISGDTGTDTIYWTAYASTDTTIDPGIDPILDSGVITADIAGGALSAVQTISGNWPQSANGYYVLVKLYSGDDINPANDQSSDGPHAISLPDVEYEITAISTVDSTPNAGSAIAESFTLHNAGADAGSASLNWYVYLSNDAAYTPGVDILIESGSEAALAGDDAGAGGPDETTIALSANWPTSPGTWYLIVRENADDEGIPGDWTASSPFSVQPVLQDIDYYVTTAPAGGNHQVGDPINESFTIGNLGSDPGSAAIDWYVYLSADAAYGPGDTLIDSGSYAGGLSSGGSSGAIAVDGDLIGGSWPAVGTYYLLVRVDAADETYPGNDLRSGGSYSINDSGAGAPDYVVSSISRTLPIVTAESAVSESFVISNVGSAGAADISWTAWASLDQNLGTDTVIGSGTISGGLASGASSGSIAINGFWPNLQSDYYIIVEVDAADETNHNDVGAAAETIQVKWPPDYIVTSPNTTPMSLGGNINESLSAVGGGTPGFSIQEIYGQSGLYSITWKLYISADDTLDAGDLPAVQSGSIPALGAGATSSPIQFDDVLPAVPGSHYYILQLSAPDDRDLSNNIYVFPPIYFWSDGDSGDGTADGADGDNSEADTTEDDLYLNMADDFFVTLNSADSVRIEGILDSTAGYSDLFYIRTGPATTQLDMALSWTSDTDADLYLFDSGGSQVGSALTATANAEVLSVSGLTPDSYYYVDVRTYTYDNSPPVSQAYELIVSAP